MKFKKIVKEARLPVMWAIDYRDFHTAIHGLIYGKNRRDVEYFYDRLKVIYADRDISPEEQEMCYQDLWDEFYPRIQQIDEINFRDIGKLPSGKYGIVIDGVEYRLVNNVAIDLYEESKKVVKEDFDKPIMPDTAVAGKPIAVRMAFAAEPGPGLLTIHSTKQCANKHEEEVFKRVMITGKPYDDDVLVAVPVLQRGVPKRYRGLLDKFGNPEKKKNMPYYPSESTRRNNKMKFKKIVEEADAKPKSDFKSLDKATWEIGKTPDGKRQNESESDNSASDHPRIYVGTYAKYNDGSIDGKWIDLTDYSDYEEFVDACRELHSDEEDPEFMVQDFENFPRKWYHEGGLPTEEEFNKINDYYLMDDNEKQAYEAYVNYTDDDDIEHFHEAYVGQFDNPSDLAEYCIDNFGWDGLGSDNLEMYFDYDAFGRDLMMDFHFGDEDNEDADGNPEDPDHYYDNDGYDMGEYQSDSQVAEDYISNIGGVDQLGPDTARNYFDYEAFGRDLLMTDYFEEDGFVFRHI